jgi:hypothetical protein
LEVFAAPDPDFAEPFFDATVERLRRTDATRVIDRAELQSVPFRAIDGLILHSGRCGSTLLSQALTLGMEIVTFREPSVLSSLLPLDSPLPGGPDLLAAVASWWSQYAADHHRLGVLKCTSTASLWAPLIREVFPDAPLWFLVRPLGEVARSLASEPPPWLDLITGSAVARSRLAATTAPLDPSRMSPLLWAAAVWVEGVRRVLQEGTEIHWIEYSDLTADPVTVVDVIRARLGLAPVSESVADGIRRLSQVDVKRGVGSPVTEREPLSDAELSALATMAETVRSDLAASGRAHLVDVR